MSTPRVHQIKHECLAIARKFITGHVLNQNLNSPKWKNERLRKYTIKCKNKLFTNGPNE